MFSEIKDRITSSCSCDKCRNRLLFVLFLDGFYRGLGPNGFINAKDQFSIIEIEKNIKGLNCERPNSKAAVRVKAEVKARNSGVRSGRPKRSQKRAV